MVVAVACQEFSGNLVHRSIVSSENLCLLKDLQESKRDWKMVSCQGQKSDEMVLSPFQQHVLLWLFLHQLWPFYKIKQSYSRYERTLLNMFNMFHVVSLKERFSKERDSRRKRGVTVRSHRNLQPPIQSLSQFRAWHALSMHDVHSNKHLAW